MLGHALTPEDIDRLSRERLEADRRYNDALTALDAAVQAFDRLPGWPETPPALDQAALASARDAWRVVPAEGPGAGRRGVRQRIASVVWGLVAPLFDRQQAFNAAVLECLARSVPAQQRMRDVIDELLVVLRAERDALSALHARMIVYLQQVTPYVDTKDREMGSMTAPLSAGLSDLADQLARQAESVAVAHRLALTVKRELDHGVNGRPGPDAVRVGHGGGEPPAAAGAGAIAGPAVAAPAAGSLRADSYKYVCFEDRFRGPREAIRRHQAQYAGLFAGASDVLDLGCGRGEFLDLLREHGIPARGIDLNHEMVELCRGRGLEVVEAEALAHLQALPDESLGGVFAAQVVEHLMPEVLLRLLDEAHRCLRPGGRILLETINVGCWTAFFSSYLRDITHVRPLHPDTLSLLVSASGFQNVRVQFSSPYPDALKLPRLDGDTAAARVINTHADTLNRLLFTDMDYAVIGDRR
jgi:SAM-dependent methyltransferase